MMNVSIVVKSYIFCSTEVIFKSKFKRLAFITIIYLVFFRNNGWQMPLLLKKSRKKENRIYVPVSHLIW